MNVLLFVAIVLAATHLFILHRLDNYRKSLQIGDVVGVVFGDVSVNRTVVRITKETVLIKSANCDRIIELKKDKTFFPSRYIKTDLPVNEVSGD
jgi:hypothetical protein